MRLAGTAAGAAGQAFAELQALVDEIGTALGGSPAVRFTVAAEALALVRRVGTAHEGAYRTWSPLLSTAAQLEAARLQLDSQTTRSADVVSNYAALSTVYLVQVNREGMERSAVHIEAADGSRRLLIAAASPISRSTAPQWQVSIFDTGVHLMEAASQRHYGLPTSTTTKTYTAAKISLRSMVSRHFGPAVWFAGSPPQ